MAHEALKRQFEEDCRNYERPWEMWEMRRTQFSKGEWKDVDKMWMEGFEYRRKEPQFPTFFDKYDLLYERLSKLRKNQDAVLIDILVDIVTLIKRK